MGTKLVWALSNFIVFVCMAGTAIISLISIRDYSGGIEHVIGASGAIKIASLVVFVLLGFPLAVSMSCFIFTFKLFCCTTRFRFLLDLLKQSFY